MDDTKIPAPFQIEHLCYLPYNLARTELVVRPCVAFLHATDPPIPTGTPARTPMVEESLIPRLDAKEVAAVFSAPFHNFLRADDEENLRKQPLPPGGGTRVRGRIGTRRRGGCTSFYVPVNNQRVTKPKVRDGGLASLAEHEEDEGEDGGKGIGYGA